MIALIRLLFKVVNPEKAAPLCFLKHCSFRTQTQKSLSLKHVDPDNTSLLGCRLEYDCSFRLSRLNFNTDKIAP